ncbi:hypothetical protein ACVWZA_004271 [Sphingomonas sp. UYAg733]
MPCLSAVRSLLRFGALGSFLFIGATPLVAQIVRKPVKPIILKPLPRPTTSLQQADPNLVAARNVRIAKLKTDSNKLVAVKTVARPGARTAMTINAQLKIKNATVRQKPKMIAVFMMPLPGVARVNGQAGGMLEPGGDYEIVGKGFGTGNGSVFLRHGTRVIDMSISHWSDGQIFAHVPDDVSGLPDAGSVELAVGPAGKPVLRTTKFGFRAARADYTLPIDNGMFSYDKGRMIRVASLEVPTNMAPSTKRYDGEYYNVSRFTQDDGGDKRCFEPGFDRISTSIPLKPGFEVTAYYFTHSPVNRGAFNFTWEPGAIRVDYGVSRYFEPRYFLLPPHGGCSSTYKVKLVATGPRGMSPQ